MRRVVCFLIGHHQPKRAMEVWSPDWRRWNAISDTVNIPVCGRCGMTLSNWSVTVR